MKIRLNVTSDALNAKTAEAFFVLEDTELSAGEQALTDIFRDLFINLVGLKSRKLTRLFLRHEPLAKIIYLNDNIRIEFSNRLRGNTYVRREFVENIESLISYLGGYIDCLESMLDENDGNVETIKNEALEETSQGAYPFFCKDSGDSSLN